MVRKIANGGVIGPRNLPNNRRANGIWDIEDAFFASRDGQWPSWPQDVGIPYHEDLLVWLESDFGVYADAEMNNPATLNGSVSGWFNRGRLGSIRRDPAGAQWNLVQETAINNRLAVNMQSTGLSEIVAATVKTNNYIFAVTDAIGTVANFFMPHDPNTGIQTTTIQPRLSVVSGANFNAPASNSGNTSVSSTGGLSSAWFETNRVDFAYAAQVPPSVVGGGGTLTRLCAGGRFDAENAPVIESFNDSVTPSSVSYTQFMRVLGTRSSSTSVGSAGSRVQALLWYSLDEPLSYTDFNAIGAYLGGKYGFR